MADYSDLGAFILARLRSLTAVQSLVVGGAARILDGGDLTGATLAAAEKERQASKAAQVLALVTMDTGEAGSVGNKTATASVFIYDRQRAYANIRAAREAVIAAVVNQGVPLVRGALVVQVDYAGRSGFVQFEDFDLDFERVDFAGPLTYDASGDSYA